MYRLFPLFFVISCIENDKSYDLAYFKRTPLCINSSQVTSLKNIESALDSDGDYIPDSVENCLGMNPLQHDENNNQILDGIDDSFDPFFNKEWYIRSLGNLVNDSNIPTIRGYDLNLIDIYHKYMGYNSLNKSPLSHLKILSVILTFVSSLSPIEQ